uniref:PDZ domain-containing protein n=1 Tax=Pyrodinium bahamense TaxID=73915 RepID=A0A7S0FBH8_9DINO
MEVLYSTEDSRVRGRIHWPPGWISLADLETGQRWAAKKAVCPKRHDLQRRLAPYWARCDSCQSIFPEGVLMLRCQACEYDLCAGCLATKSDLHVWSFELTATETEEGSLGFTCEALSSERILLREVQDISWAAANGLLPGDELVAVGGRLAAELSLKELGDLFDRVRPLELSFAYRGECDAVSMTFQGVDCAALSANLSAAMVLEAVLREALAAEVGCGVSPADVEVSLYTGSALFTKCVVSPPEGVLASELHAKLVCMGALPKALATRLSALPGIKAVSSGAVAVRDLKPSKRSEPEAQGVVRLGLARPQIANRVLTWPSHWGVTRAQCMRLLRQLRADPNWKCSNTVYTMVSDFIIPMTQGKGLGYAALENVHNPREVNVMVVHAWGENAENFLEAIVRSTTQHDVMFICALSLYQAEDAAGPSVVGQFGCYPNDTPFRQVARYLQAQHEADAARPQTRRQVPQALQALSLVLLASALLCIYGPILAWGCTPTFDMSECLVRRPPEQTMQIVEWLPVEHFEPVRGGFIVGIVLAVLAVASHWMLAWLQPCTARVLVVADPEVDLSSRLWCLHHLWVADSLGVPLQLAATLADVGHESCRPELAVCAQSHYRELLLQQIKHGVGGRQGFAGMEQAIQAMCRCRDRHFNFMVLGWSAVWALLRCADHRLAMAWDAEQESAFLLAILGALVGTGLAAGTVRRTVLVARGVPSGGALGVVALALLASGWLAISTLAFAGLLQPRAWTGVVNAVFDESYRHRDVQQCTSSTCQHFVAFISSFAQTLMIAAANLAMCLLCAFCCPGFLRWRPYRPYDGTPNAIIALVAIAIAVVAARFILDEPPHEDYAFAVLFLYLTQLCARCLVPALVLWAVVSAWGLRIRTRGRSKDNGSAEDCCVVGRASGSATYSLDSPRSLDTAHSGPEPPPPQSGLRVQLGGAVQHVSV